MNAGSFAIDINKIRNGQRSPQADSVAVEEPLEIRLGFSTPDGRAVKSISITMRTPGDDEELAAGFLFTEAIIHSARDIAAIELCGPTAPDSGNHNVIQVELQAGVDVDLGRLQRHFYTTSSCGVQDGALVSLTSRKGDITLRATITTRVKPGVVYTTFHNPETGANVVTTEYSDWATNCPEYKVTAVQIAPASHRSKWQDGFDARAKRQGHIIEA